MEENAKQIKTMIDISKAQQINGWMSEGELIWLAERAKASKIILEFGCYKGRSTRALADNTEGIIYAVDPWSGDYYSDDGKSKIFSCEVNSEFYNNLSDHILNNRVFLFKTYSTSFIPLLRPDFVFLDGDHHYQAVKDDINHVMRICHPRCIIAGHDYGRSDWPGVKQAVDEIFGDKALIHDTIWYVEMV
jgi:predicted O-methyltransferase YrrM